MSASPLSMARVSGVNVGSRTMSVLEMLLGFGAVLQQDLHHLLIAASDCDVEGRERGRSEVVALALRAHVRTDARAEQRFHTHHVARRHGGNELTGLLVRGLMRARAFAPRTGRASGQSRRAD